MHSFKEFWGNFVRRSVVMDWIENGYKFLWTEVAPSTKEMANAPSANEHHDFFSSAVVEMLAANAVTLLPPGEKPAALSPLGVVMKRGTDKFRLTAMRELVMFWRRDGIKLLPYLDDFMFMKFGFWQCDRMARRMERDFIRAGLMINVPKCHSIPAQQRRQLGFDVDFAQGKFQVPADRWVAVKVLASVLLFARNGRVHARSLARMTETVKSIHLSWGPVTQLYTRHLYALINSVVSLNC